MLGIDREQIVEVIASRGMDGDEALAELPEIESGPAFHAGHAFAQRLAKLESYLDIRQDLARLSPARAVDLRQGLTTAEFRDEYYGLNRPVLLADVATEWPALRLWDPEYLRGVLGDEPVEIMADRDADTRYEVNSVAHKRMVAFSTYVDAVVSTRGNDAYLVANNRLLDREAARPLWNDFTIDGRYLYTEPPPGTAFLWFGPAGTITPLHHDVANILFTEVHGRKRVTLISPLESHCVYNDVAVYSSVDLTAPDLERFPRFERVAPIDVVVEPGQTLFIPVGWWHHVESLDTSITLSFTNFRFPNTFEWRHPELSGS
jgi:hypothetical protein